MTNREKSLVYVFDSFALLAYFGGEKGAEKVKQILENAAQKKCLIYLSIINLGEVLYIVERESGFNSVQKVLGAVEQLPLFINPVSFETVFSAAHIKANYSLSYADSFAVVVCKNYNGILVTGDPEFKPLETKKIISVEWLPQKNK